MHGDSFGEFLPQIELFLQLSLQGTWLVLASNLGPFGPEELIHLAICAGHPVPSHDVAEMGDQHSREDVCLNPNLPVQYEILKLNSTKTEITVQRTDTSDSNFFSRSV